MPKYKTNSLSKYNSKKLKSPSFSPSLIKVHLLNSKIIKSMTNNLYKKNNDQNINNTRIFSASKNIKTKSPNKLVVTKKDFSKEKKNIFNKKQTIKNHNNSVIIKEHTKTNTINASKRNITNSIKLDYNQDKVNKKFRPNSPVCHLYYKTKNFPPENINCNIIKSNHNCYLAMQNNNISQYKSKKINNSGSTGLSFSESCINSQISGKVEFLADTVISSTTSPFESNLIDDTLNFNINNSKIDKNISDNKVTLNIKNDTSLLTFGNSFNDSAKKSYDSATKKYITNLKKENELLKYQLNKKNEKINILQQKIEALLLNNTECDYLRNELINNFKYMEKNFPEFAINYESQLSNDKIKNDENKKQYNNFSNKYIFQNTNSKVIKRMRSCSTKIQNQYKNKIRK